MTKEYKLYRLLYPIFKIILILFGFPNVIGRENIPEGACVVVANHTSNLDSFFMIDALTRRNHVRILAKAELYKVPVLGTFLRKIGMIRVDRSIADVTPVRESLAHLKSGGKIGIFPEGTRISNEESTEAKTGAVRIAERTGAPLLPIFIPRKKRLFRPNLIVVGKPYTIKLETKRPTPAEIFKLSEEMMRRIYELEVKPG